MKPNLAPEPERSTTERLFDAAAALFWREGFAATTTREIASALGIQQASLYHHMASKDDLLHRICLSSLEPFLTGVPAMVRATERPLERIHLFIRAHLTTLLRYQQRNVTFLTELRSLSARHRKEVLALRDQYEQFSRSTLENAQNAGAIRADVPVKYLSLALMSMLNHAALWFRREKALNENQLAGIFTKVYLDGAAAPGARTTATLPDFGTQGKKPGARARKAPLGSDNPALGRALDAAVLFLICQSSLERIRTDVESAIRDSQDSLDRMRSLICSHIESLLRNEAMHSTTFTEMHALSEVRLEQVLKLRDTYENLVRTVLQEAYGIAAPDHCRPIKSAGCSRRSS